MTVLIVTGTDTDVGKTIATAALVHTLRETGAELCVVKPTQTGVSADEAGDLDTVRSLIGDVPGWEGARLRDPLAPATAARVAGQELPTLAELTDRLDNQASAGHLVIEGAGGVLVELTGSATLLDVADGLVARGHAVRFVVVARAGLGTLNHTALTTQAIARRGHQVAGVIVGSWPDVPDLAAEQNLIDLPRLAEVPLLGRIPAGAGAWSSADFTRHAASWLPEVTADLLTR